MTRVEPLAAARRRRSAAASSALTGLLSRRASFLAVLRGRLGAAPGRWRWRSRAEPARPALGGCRLRSMRPCSPSSRRSSATIRETRPRRRCSWMFARGLGDRYRGLFHGPPPRRPEAMAAGQPEEDLVRLRRRPRRRRRSPGSCVALSAERLGWTPPFGWPAGRLSCRLRASVGEPARRSRRIGPEAAFRRQGFEPPHPRAWRRHGPPRRLLGRLRPRAALSSLVRLGLTGG